MFINVTVCFLVSIETNMLAADFESTALRISCAKQKLHGPMNSLKRGLGIASVMATVFSLTQIIVMWEQLNWRD